MRLREPKCPAAGRWAVMLCVLALVGHREARAQESEGDTAFDWRSDWAVDPGFAVEIDTEGYHFPTAIAFVPEPGDAPDDPLYFVAELRGKLKVVTIDRTVHTFADVFPRTELYETLPRQETEFGMAGICLAPRQGYVFVTFAYQDSEGTLRNNIVRFETRPGRFALEPSARVDFTDLFLPYESGPSHQIGGCQIVGNTLYVGVGDGYTTPETSQQLDVLLGKVLRMTLDGEPPADNPFYGRTDPDAAAGYVWAAGLRNPFSLAAVDDRVFVADNGPHVDRFLEVERGANYLWDGSDWSAGTNAAVVFHPIVAPVQMDHLPAGSELFPSEYTGKFYVASTGQTLKPEGSPARVEPGVVTLGYDLGERRMRSVPRHLMRYRGPGYQALVGLGFGPDGLYVVPLAPNRAGRSVVLRVSHDPANEHPFVLGREEEASYLIAHHGCLSCHSLDGTGGARAPALDRDALAASVRERLASEEYLASLEAQNRRGRPHAAERTEVLEADGAERLRVWVKNRIKAPTFDNPATPMPTLGLTDRQAEILARQLLAEPPELTGTQKIVTKIRELVPPRFGRKHMLLAFAAGFLGGGLITGVSLVAIDRRRAPQT